MVILRKAVWPMRDVVNRFQRLEQSFVNPTTLLYLRDVYDHIVQTIDIIEGFRDVVSGMVDIYLSNINIRTNDIMKVLTIVSTIFVPLTFISSLYGMNFEMMPELHLSSCSSATKSGSNSLPLPNNRLNVHYLLKVHLG
jgi:magnesium transporter